MSIKPVLVPDHDAAALRGLMDRFAEASTGPTRQQLAESRAAVAAAQGVAESSNELYGLRVGDTVKAVVNGKRVQGDVIDIFPETMEVELLLRGVNAGRTITVDVRDTEALSEQGVAEGSMYSDEEVSWEKGGRRAPTGAFRNPAAEPMPVNKYIAQELDTLLKLAQDQVDDITNRSRDGYGNKKSSGLEDAIFELSGVSNGFHSSMAEGVAELQELNSGLPRIGNWIMRNLKKVGNRIDLPQLIKQETSNNQGVTETHDNDARAVLRNRIVADVLNFYSLNDRIPSIKEFSRPVRAKLNALEFDERSTVFRQAVVQALKLLGKQGMSAALTLDEAGRPDVMRHAGDTTVKVVKRGGRPIGEIGIDAEASEGNGQYYVKLYDGSYDAVGFDTAAEALAELKYAISEGLAEVLGTSPDRLMARTGMNLPHKFPRAGQTNLGNIPGTNLPDSSEQTKKYGQERRANRPDNLKAAIRDQLGKHNRPDLPESGVTEARNNVSVPAALEMLKDARAYLDQFDPEDDDDYFDAYETIAAEFDMESNDSSNDPLTDLLDMYEVNPQQAAQMLADHLQSQSKEVDEGLKSKLAGVALVGAAALGGGVAGAQTTDKYDTAWGTSGYDTSIRSDKSLTRSMGSDPSKDVNDFQKRIQSVTGPNARGEYKVVVIQGNDIVSHYVTKTPPPGWLYKEDAESKTEEGMIDNIKNTVRAANYDRLSRRSNSQAVAGGGLAPPAQFKSLSAKGDQRAQKAQDIRKGDVAEGYDDSGAYDKWDPKHPDFVKNFRKFQASNPGATLKDFIADLKKGVTESVDPIEQLRADIRRFAQ